MRAATKIATLSAAVAMIAIACKPNEIENRRSSGTCRKTTSLELLATADYTTDAKPIIDSKCATCHAGVASSRSPALNTYASVKQNYQAALQEIITGKMPPSGAKLTSAEQQTLKDWASSGFIETKTSTSTTTTYSYVNDIQPLLQSKCLGCHKSGGKQPDLSTYTLVKNNATMIATAVATDQMPRSTPLSTTDKAKLAAWVASGAPNGTPTTSTPTTDNTSSSSDATLNPCL